MIVRSLSFGSKKNNLNALNFERIRFRFSLLLFRLSLLLFLTRWHMMQKVLFFQNDFCSISSSFSLPARGSFHLSFTVLLHYRSFFLFRLKRWSFPFQTKFHGICFTPFRILFFNYGAFTLSGKVSQTFSYKKKNSSLGLMFAHHYLPNRFCFLFL